MFSVISLTQCPCGSLWVSGFMAGLSRYPHWVPEMLESYHRAVNPMGSIPTWTVSCHEAVTVGGGWAGERGTEGRRRPLRAGSQGLGTPWGITALGTPELYWFRDRQGGQPLKIEAKAKAKPSAESASRSGCPPSPREDLSTYSLSRVSLCLLY